MAKTVRPAWAEIDLAAIRQNCQLLTELFAPASLCAVVKADAYGHGAVPVAQAAIAGGAQWLAVALVEEGSDLREAGVTTPILLLSQPSEEAMDEVVANDITPSLYTRAGVRAVADAVKLSGKTDYSVQLKADTGMHRVGAAPDVVPELIREVVAQDGLAFQGLWTHFAVADELNNDYTQFQIDQFEALLAELPEPPVLTHTSNTAAGVRFAGQRRSLVRCGIGMFGVAPGEVPLPEGIRPAMTVRTQVAFAKRLKAGSALSYGLAYRLERDAYVATIPLGYADGIPRLLSSRGAEVLIGGQRHRMAGNVTMDQTIIDCGDYPVSTGEEVVLLGTQSDESITANDWGKWSDSVGYEIVCRIGPRLPRRYIG